MKTKLEKLTNLFTFLVVILTTFQGLIPTLPANDPHVITYVSAIVMFLVSTFTALKQWASTEIANNALKSTLIVALIGIIGGANDIFDVIQFGPITDQWVRFGLTFVTMSLSLASKLLWPTPATTTKI